MTVTSCVVYKVIMVLESIDHLCINPINMIGFIPKVYTQRGGSSAAISLELTCVCSFSKRAYSLSSWLSFAMSNCQFVTFPLVSWIRRGT